jgi:hypothetical protein
MIELLCTGLTNMLVIAVVLAYVFLVVLAFFVIKFMINTGKTLDTLKDTQDAHGRRLEQLTSAVSMIQSGLLNLSSAAQTILANPEYPQGITASIPSQLVKSQLVPSQLVPSQLVPSQLVKSQLVPSQLVPSQGPEVSLQSILKLIQKNPSILESIRESTSIRESPSLWKNRY